MAQLWHGVKQWYYIHCPQSSCRIMWKLIICVAGNAKTTSMPYEQLTLLRTADEWNADNDEASAIPLDLIERGIKTTVEVLRILIGQDKVE